MNGFSAHLHSYWRDVELAGALRNDRVGEGERRGDLKIIHLEPRRAAKKLNLQARHIEGFRNIGGTGVTDSQNDFDLLAR